MCNIRRVCHKLRLILLQVGLLANGASLFRPRRTLLNVYHKLQSYDYVKSLLQVTESQNNKIKFIVSIIKSITLLRVYSHKELTQIA